MTASTHMTSNGRGSDMGEVSQMSPAERSKVIEAAREVAAEFSRVGAKYDELGEFPVEMVTVYKEAGLPGLPVPKEYGGAGADLVTIYRVSAELAKGDPSFALAFNMHYAMIGIFRETISDEAKEKWFPQFAVERKLVNGALSEARAGLTGLADTTATPLPDGRWEINGKKTWSTLCEGADITSFNATITNPDGSLPEDFRERVRREAIFITPMDTPGIRIQKTWDALGMRATGTQTTHFERAILDPDSQLAPFIAVLGNIHWGTPTFGGVYQGLAERTYDETVKILRTKSLGVTRETTDVVLRDQGAVQRALGQMAIAKERSNRVLEATCADISSGRILTWDPMERVALIEVAKITSVETALTMVNEAMRLVGGSSFRRGHPLEKLYRDARAGPFHAMTSDQVADTLGRSALGVLAAPPADVPEPQPVA
jgi:alkylation response protein AidB-like acyl-CoA dehydrogenase